jgi:hypothetical protein
MVKAVLKNGTIQPLEPLPANWVEGSELEVEEARRPDSPEEADRWYQQLEALVAPTNPQDIEIIEATLAEADRQAKALVRLT